MKFSSTCLCLCLCGISAALALENPATTPRKTTASRVSPDDSVRRAAAETAAAIETLGAQPSTRHISGIVFKAVRSSPDNVLSIVNAAVRVSPKPAAPEIVTAAVAAVPNPWRQMVYHRKKSQPDYNGGSDGKSGPDGNQARNGGPNMDLGGRGPGDPGSKSANGNSANGRSANGSFANGTYGILANGSFEYGNSTNGGSGNGAFGNGGFGSSAGDPAQGGNVADGSQMTLAEAIALTAFASQPGLSFPSLQGAVDLALRTDPATLLRDVQSSRAISGVGDAGGSNYANEPLRTPNPPVVSR